VALSIASAGALASRGYLAACPMEPGLSSKVTLACYSRDYPANTDLTGAI